jgi:F420-dependent methylenetetrahydromethanopterin dehydrogenase
MRLFRVYSVTAIHRLQRARSSHDWATAQKLHEVSERVRDIEWSNFDVFRKPHFRDG